jgi:TonB family protein
MNSLMRQGAVKVLLIGALVALAAFSSSAQESAKRKILQHAAPAYPDLARNMALEGVVKVEALVAPDGSVKSVEIRGGHPVLAQAAANTVRHWRWEPAARESHETVEIKFTPPAD